MSEIGLAKILVDRLIAHQCQVLNSSKVPNFRIEIGIMLGSFECKIYILDGILFDCFLNL